MPNEHYMIVAKQLLGCASDDIPRANEIRTIIKDIWDIRMSKLRSSVDLLIRSSGSYAAVDNLTIMEINLIRPILPHALDQIYRMQKVCHIFERNVYNCFFILQTGMNDSRQGRTPHSHSKSSSTFRL